MPTEQTLATSHLDRHFTIQAPYFAEHPVFKRILAGKIVRIMGPCALQSVEQMEAMLEIIGEHVDLVRAPAKKPRTVPLSANGDRLFDGVGIAKGVPMLECLRQRHPELQFAGEVMSARDLVQMRSVLALPWVGARNVTNHESVRDIGAQAMRERLPLMLKNPMVRSTDAMIGALQNALIGADFALPVILCMRGVEPEESEKKTWRNAPNIQLIPALRRQYPQLPILVDPSHMFLKDELKPEAVVELIRQAIDLGAHGFILELNTLDHPSKTDPGVDAAETVKLLKQKGLA